MFDFIYQAFGMVLNFFYSLIPNYAVALLLFAVFVKIILFPLGIKQQKNMVKQASLRPKEMAIRAKYAGRTDKVTQQKLNEEIMTLYQSENFNPMSGCLPLLVQLPIIWILYGVIRNPLKYVMMLSDTVLYGADGNGGIAAIYAEIKEVAVETIVKNNDMQFVSAIKENWDKFAEALKDYTIADLPNFEIFGGFDLAQTPSLGLNLLVLVPILTFVAQYGSMKLTRKFSYQPPQQDGTDAGKSMKIMDITMPLFSVFIAFTFPAILGVYWIYQSVLGVVQQYILYKLYPIPTFSEEELKRLEKEYGGKKASKEKKNVRSLHNIDAEDGSNDEKSQNQPASEALRAEIKDESDRPARAKNADGDAPKKKVRSLHHIDSPGYDNGYKIDENDTDSGDNK